MNSNETYIFMVQFLDRYYQRTKLDDLGCALGSMDPFLWTNIRPIDPCMLPKWNDITKKEEVNERKCVQYFTKFIEYLEQEFKYNLNSIKKDLIEMGSNELIKDWRDSKMEAAKLYEKYESQIAIWHKL